MRGDSAGGRHTCADVEESTADTTKEEVECVTAKGRGEEIKECITNEEERSFWESRDPNENMLMGLGSKRGKGGKGLAWDWPWGWF